MKINISKTQNPEMDLYLETVLKADFRLQIGRIFVLWLYYELLLVSPCHGHLSQKI